MRMKKIAVTCMLTMMLTGGVFGRTVQAEEVNVENELFKLLDKMEMHKYNQIYGTNFKPVNSEQEYKNLSASEMYQKGTKGFAIWYPVKRTPYSPPTGQGYNVIKNDSLSIKDASADLESFTEEIAGNVYAGTNILDNTKSSVDQTLNTIEFNIQQADTVSNATTLGLKIGTSAKAKVNFLLAESEFTVSTEFNVSNTQTTTKTTTKSFKAPSQSIKVPAGKKYRVRALLNKIRGKAIVNLYTTLERPELYVGEGRDNGVVRDNRAPQGQYIDLAGGQYTTASDIYQYVLNNNLMEPSPYYEANGNDFTFKGKGWISMEQGTNFSLVVEDITPMPTRSGARSAHQEQAKVVQTLTVQPEIHQ